MPKYFIWGIVYVDLTV